MGRKFFICQVDSREACLRAIESLEAHDLSQDHERFDTDGKLVGYLRGEDMFDNGCEFVKLKNKPKRNAG